MGHPFSFFNRCQFRLYSNNFLVLELIQLNIYNLSILFFIVRDCTLLELNTILVFNICLKLGRINRTNVHFFCNVFSLFYRVVTHFRIETVIFLNNHFCQCLLQIWTLKECKVKYHLYNITSLKIKVMIKIISLNWFVELEN